MSGGWWFVLLLCSLAHAQLFVSLSGANSSTTCSSTDPCASVAQAVQVHNAITPSETLHIMMAGGLYTGELNTNVRLPDNVPSVIEHWDSTKVTIQITNTTQSAIFITSSPLTLIGLDLSAQFNSLVWVPSAVPPNQVLDVIVQGGSVFCSNNLVLLSNSPSGVSLTLESIVGVSNLGLYQKDWALASLALYNVSLTSMELDLTAGSISVTNCTFEDMDPYFVVDCNYTLTWSGNSVLWTSLMFNTRTAFSLSAGNVAHLSDSVIFAYLTYHYFYLDGASLLLEDTSINMGMTFTVSDELIIRGSYFSGSSTTMMIVGTPPQVVFEGSEWNGCAVPLRMSTVNQIAVSNCTFEATGSLYLGAKYSGTISDSYFLKGKSFQLGLGAGDWTLSNTMFGTSPGTYTQTLDFSSPDSLTVQDSHFQGNEGSYGRAILVRTGNLNVQRSLFEEISCNSIGCAIQFEGELIKITDTTFQDIYGEGSINQDGGAVAVGSANSAAQTTLIQSCTFSGCGIGNGGRGGSISAGGDVNITGCTFESCSGGAIFLDDPTGANISLSEFSNCENPIYIYNPTYLYGNAPRGATLERLLFEDSGSELVTCSAPDIPITLNSSLSIVVDGSSRLHRDDISNCLVTYLYGTANIPDTGLAVLVIGTLLVIILVGAFLLYNQLNKGH